MEAELRAGDIIIAVKGRPAARLTAEQLRQLFRLEGKRYILQIRRGEARLRITLRTRRLI
jgi:antitoxin (DNA-binding transcriptional repressor) of toxin-antitoxin stability system